MEVFSFTSLLFEIIAHQKPFFWYINMYLSIYVSIYIYTYIDIYIDIYTCLPSSCEWPTRNHSSGTSICYICADKFTPTKHLTPPPHHSSRPAAAHTDTETPLQ